MRYIVLHIVLLFALITNAQDYKRTQNWYFGDSAGLSFATDPPTPLTDGAMNTIEGCATISDTAGNLLFYTNGVKVWNKNHQIMENGTGLNAAQSSSQSSLIVPWPENDSLFYIFTTDEVAQSKGLQYSIININANDGLGKVLKKNNLLLTPVCEKLTATYHQNGKDIWVVCHGWNNSFFYTYLITNKGLIECPIISSSGSVHGGSSLSAAQGIMKFSFSGNLIATTVYLGNTIELFSFDRKNGVISNSIVISGFLLPYGLEFSEKEKFLYVTSRDKKITQVNIVSNPNVNKFVIYNSPFDNLSSLQLGTNGKIYLAHGDSLSLSKINYPDSSGASCEFVLTGINLLGKKSKYGLPNFVTSYFYTPKLDFTYTTNCVNDSFYFASKGCTSHAWQIFRNKAILHSSTQSTTNFTFTDTGEYTIQLVSGIDTVTKTIYIEPKLTLGQDTILCNQNSYSLIIPTNHRCITWQDGADSIRYTLTQSGTYSVNANNSRGCLVSDTVKITFTTLAAPIITMSNDSLFIDSGNYTYKWYYNNAPVPSNTYTIKISKNGNYRVEITDSNGCSNTSANFLAKGLGIQILKAENYFEIYPIPTNNTLFIENKHNLTLQSIRVKDIAGRIFNYTPNTILSLEALAKGIYYLEITDTENNHYTSKIILN